MNYFQLYGIYFLEVTNHLKLPDFVVNNHVYINYRIGMMNDVP